jgi:hypothetical protein
MLRIAASMAIMFLAVGWSALGVLIIFLFVPWAWEAIFGPAWAPLGALLALVGMIWLSARLMRFADRVIETSERHAPALAATPADVPSDWKDYTAEIVRNKRWAFYRRTRQFERLAELEASNRRRPATNTNGSAAPTKPPQGGSRPAVHQEPA